uniref:Chemosensory protein 1 n=1 Tax=Cnaphalocrocis medinalis TaxID=437488 RepID=M4Y1W3_CNAME|nr:chemosensory protein 1 [Cnaphalocrocis medinalis]
MKSFVFFFLSALMVAAMAADYNDLKDVNLEELLSDEARRKQIFDCVMDLGPCGEYQIYKDVVPGVIATQCGDCTPELKKKYEENSKFLLEKYPKEFTAVVEKYGPKKEE